MTQDEIKSLELRIERLSGADRTTSLYRIVVLVLIMLNALLNTFDMEDCSVDAIPDKNSEMEVSLDVDGTRLARVGFFKRDDDGWDVVAGVAETVLAGHIASVLRAAAAQLETVSHWQQIDDVRPSGFAWNEERGFPF